MYLRTPILSRQIHNRVLAATHTQETGDGENEIQLANNKYMHIN